MTQKAWVTGSRGFVGSALVKCLLKHGFNVTRVSNLRPAHEDISYVEYGSRRSIRSVLAAEGPPNVIFHLGWGAVYEPESSVHLLENVSNAKTLFDELYLNGLEKAILIGSSSEYGDREGCLVEDDAPTGRLTKYAQGKIQSCRDGFDAAAKYGTVFLHIRLFHTLGAGKRQGSLFNQLYKSYCDSSELGLTACDQFRDYISLTDAVEGMIKISGISSSEIVNLGSGNKIQLKELVNMFWSKLGGRDELLRFGVRERPGHEPVQPPCYASLEKLRRLTGWQPNLPIEEAVARTIVELKMRS